MEKLIIDRQRWLHGEGIEDSYLLRESDGKMCCLGFFCLMEGLTEDDIRNNTTPAKIPVAVNIKDMEPLIILFSDEDAQIDSEVCTNLTQANDTLLRTHYCGHYFTTEAEREEYIATMFREELGVEVEFIN